MKVRINHFLSNIKSILKKPEIGVLPGQLAFFFVLSVVPIITLIAYGAAFFNLSMEVLPNFLENAFSKEVVDLLKPMIIVKEINVNFVLFLVVAFFIASNGARSIIVTSNTIYGITNTNAIKRRIKAIVMTIIIVLLFLFILVVPVFGNSIIEFFEFLNLEEGFITKITFVLRLLKGPLSWFIMFIFIKIIYTMAPEKRISSSDVNYGAVFTSILWALTTAIYSYYITHFANYQAFYAGLSNIVILMLWVYFLATIFVWGMVLNYKEAENKLAKTAQIKTK